MTSTMPSDAGGLAFGDIILVPFPFTNQAASKQRPAVVISNQRYNESKSDVIEMAVTSQLLGDARADDVPVSAWEAAELLKPSAIKPVIATLEQALIIRRLGALEAADTEALRSALARIIA
jgi:mRNA interferase MazF